jgi:hypothetical protein
MAPIGGPPFLEANANIAVPIAGQQRRDETPQRPLRSPARENKRTSLTWLFNARISEVLLVLCG